MKKDQIHIDQKLLVLYLLDEISQQGRATVEAWLQASEENRTYFVSFEKTWNAAGTVEPASIAFDTNRAWDRMQKRMGEEQREGEERKIGEEVIGLLSPRPLSSKRALRLVMAAAAMLLIGVASVVFIRMNQNRQDNAFITVAATVVPVQDTLTDGSTIVLNSNSELKVPRKFAKINRKVELRGEAFFHVQPDALHPFIIDAGLGQVKVLGTSFHVRAYPGSDLEVYVESGRVELSRVDPVKGDTIMTVLKAGERGIIRLGANDIGKPADIGADELFWANKKLIFQETKLSLVFDLLKKHYEADIQVQDSTILNCLLSATFTDEPIDQILEVVVASFDLTMSRDKGKFIINGKGCTDGKK